MGKTKHDKIISKFKAQLKSLSKKQLISIVFQNILNASTTNELRVYVDELQHIVRKRKDKINKKSKTKACDKPKSKYKIEALVGRSFKLDNIINNGTTFYIESIVDTNVIVSWKDDTYNPHTSNYEVYQVLEYFEEGDWILEEL